MTTKLQTTDSRDMIPYKSQH